MNIKEGRCPNCGSILNLNATAEKGHCLFCDAVFDNKTAFEIAASPKGVVFPNLPQPKYSGPNLDPGSVSAAAVAGHLQKQSQAAKKTERKEPPAIYIPKEPTKLPGIKLSPKTKRLVLIISVSLLVIIAAIFVPLFLNRDHVRAELISQMEQIAPFSVNTEQAVTIHRTDNSFLIIAAGTSVSEVDMIKLFRNYCQQRAKAMKLDLDNFNRVYKPVTVKLVTPEGGYLIAEPKNESELESGSAIVKLP